MSIQRAFGFGLLLLVATATAQNKVPWKLIKSGPNCKATNFSEQVIRTPQAFEDYWPSTQGTVLPPKGLDWSNSVLIAINLGHRGSRAYTARVLSVVQEGDETVVNWVETMPSPRMLQRIQKASPYVIVSIPPPSGPVVFKGKVEQQGAQFTDGNAFSIKAYLSGGHCMVKAESSAVLEDEAGFNALLTKMFGPARRNRTTEGFLEVSLRGHLFGPVPNARLQRCR